MTTLKTWIIIAVLLTPGLNLAFLYVYGLFDKCALCGRRLLCEPECENSEE